MLLFQLLQGFHHFGANQFRVCLFREPQKPVAMALAHRLRLSCLYQPIASILPYGLQQTVARPALALLVGDQALIRQSRQ